MDTRLRSARIIAYLIIYGCGIFPSISQSWNLHTVLDQSLKNFPSIKARSADISSAREELSLSTFDYLPKLALQHQFTLGTNNGIAGSFYPNPAVINPSGGIRAENSATAAWGSLTSVLVEWNVFNFGKINANKEAAIAYLDQTKAAYEQELFQYQVYAADAYLQTLIAEKLNSIQQANLERAFYFRQAVDAGVRSGLRPGVDSSLAHAEYVKASLLLLESKKHTQAQLYRLAELMGGSDQDILLIDSMKFFTALPVTANTNDNEKHPLLEYYRSKVNATQSRSIAIKKSIIPSVTLIGAAWARGSGISPKDDSFETGFISGTQYQVYNYLLGISARWTLTDFISVKHRFQSEKYKALKDQEYYQEQVIKVQRQRKETSNQYEVALQQAQTAPIQLRAAQQAYQQANARYKSGLSDLPTILQSILTLNRAEADLAISYSNVWRSLLAIAAAKGDLSIFLQAIN